jgi:hypothetical protein
MVLALGVAMALVAGVLVVSLSPGEATPGEVTFLSTLAGAAVGAVAAYLGITQLGGNKMSPAPKTPEPPAPEPEDEPTGGPEPETPPEYDDEAAKEYDDAVDEGGGMGPAE